MKYAIIDQTKGDWFESIFDTPEDAIREADHYWAHLAKNYKNNRIAYFVASCELDEDDCIDWDTVNPIKNYK